MRKRQEARPHRADQSAAQFAGAAQSAALALAAKPQAAYALDKRWLARGLREEFAAAARSQKRRKRCLPHTKPRQLYLRTEGAPPWIPGTRCRAQR
jgi:hypothetical protein